MLRTPTLHPGILCLETGDPYSSHTVVCHTSFSVYAVDFHLKYIKVITNCSCVSAELHLGLNLLLHLKVKPNQLHYFLVVHCGIKS